MAAAAGSTPAGKLAVMSTPFLYAGPTLFRAMRMAKPDLDGISVLPPVNRDDVLALCRQQRPGVMIICDGNFHLDHLAVGHAELRHALRLGWQVWGVSSMGAIRAAELRSLGMQGFGVVFAAYRDDPELRDDEVALLHEPSPPYREGSEPLFHIRRGLDWLVQQHLLSAEAASAIVADLAKSWFGDRTLSDLRDRLQRAGVAIEPLAAFFADFDRHRQKAWDLLALLSQRPWHRSSRHESV